MAEATSTKNPQPLNPSVLDVLSQYRTTPAQFSRLYVLLNKALTETKEIMSFQLPVIVKELTCLSAFKTELIGSSIEGLSLTENSETGYGEELDMTMILDTITLTEDLNMAGGKGFGEVQYCDEFPGHAFIRIHHSETASEWCPVCDIVSSETGHKNEFYLSPVAVTDEMYLMMSYRYGLENLAYLEQCEQADVLLASEDSSVMAKLDPNAHTAAGPEDVARAKTNNYPIEQNAPVFRLLVQEGPAIKTTLFHEDVDVIMQYDISVGIRLTTWPSPADGWVSRTRVSGWPSVDIINNVTATGCLFVPKSPASTKTNREWRMSFCIAEKLLIEDLSEHQRVCYIILKAIWRQFLKPPAGKGLQSYQLKTVFLWECEKIPSCSWNDGNYSLRIMGLLESLTEFLKKEYCPHYFLPENNLFQDIEKCVLTRASERVQTCMTEASAVWINNDEIFYLPAQHTRTGMTKLMYQLYVKTLKTMCKELLASGLRHEHDCITQQQSILDEASINTLRQCLEPDLGNSISSFVIQCLSSPGLSDKNSLMKTYMCARSSPRELLKAAKLGALNPVAEMVSLMMVWGTMIDFVIKLKVLNSESLAPYGFPEHFVVEEFSKLVREHFAANDFDMCALVEAMAQPLLDLDDDDDNEGDMEIICDVCENTLFGRRFHCTECEDFDLCDSCYQNNTTHHHQFVCENNTCDDATTT